MPGAQNAGDGGSVTFRCAQIISKDTQFKFRIFIGTKDGDGRSLDVDRKWASSTKTEAYKRCIEKVNQFWAS